MSWQNAFTTALYISHSFVPQMYVNSQCVVLAVRGIFRAMHKKLIIDNPYTTQRLQTKLFP